MNDLMEDSARALHFYMDPKNREQFLEVASRVSKQPPSAFGFAYTKNDLYRDPNFRPNLESLQRAVDVLPELGIAESEDGCHEICGSELCRRGGTTAQVKPRVAAMVQSL